jgi:hypothetical protein
MRSDVRIPGSRRPRPSPSARETSGFNAAAMVRAIETMPDAGRLDVGPALEAMDKATKAAKPAGEAKGYAHEEECNPDGASQLERGDVTEMGLRIAVGLRAAIDDAIDGLAKGFNLEDRVLRGEFGTDGAEYRIGLEVKERRKIKVLKTGTAPIVPSVGEGEPLGSARLPRTYAAAKSPSSPARAERTLGPRHALIAPPLIQGLSSSFRRMIQGLSSSFRRRFP